MTNIHQKKAGIADLISDQTESKAKEKKSAHVCRNLRQRNIYRYI